ncbi:MAG: DOMON-like domain-containing protein [Sphingomonas sp.]|nr:DOMON-like domain-containing protein [Sphingomonas sp.]
METVEVAIDRPDPDTLALTFLVAPAAHLNLPEPASPSRTDGLWKRTCFELFVAGAGERYLEFNLSPSSRWAAYAFDRYRTGMRDLPMATDPQVEVTTRAGAIAVRAAIDLTGAGAGPLTIGLSAVIEEDDGTRSYWALRHPPGAPDFHHRDCFALELPAPEAP